VSHGRSERCQSRYPDVRPSAGRGARSCENDHRQPDVAQNEADEPAGEGGYEAPKRDGGEDERVQTLEYRA
jgi:hypothetical protein